MVFYVATLLIVAGVALYVASPLVSGFVRRRRPKSREELSIEHWQHEHALAVQGLRELEFDRQMGKLADADYESLHATLETKALEAMSALEKIRSGIRRKRFAGLEATPKAKPATPAQRSTPATVAEPAPPTALTAMPQAQLAVPVASVAPPAPIHPGSEPRWTSGASVGGAEHRRGAGAPRLRFCPQCGMRALATANFCGECGASLRGSERVTTRAL